MSLREVPMMKAVLIREREGEGVLVVVMHHIASDGWSMGVMIEEVGEEYERGGRVEKREGEGGRGEEIGYVDYAVWQRERMREGGMEEEVGYWKEQLRGAGAALELPTDRPRPAVQTFEGDTEELLLSKKLARDLKELSRREESTLFMTLLAGFATLLHRYTWQEDIVIGTSIAGRNRRETERLIGFFVNTLALRTDLSGTLTFRDVMRRVRAVTLEAYAHQDLPFEKVVEEVQPSRDLSRPPIFQVMLVLQNTPTASIKLDGLKFTPIQIHRHRAKFELTLFVTETQDGLLLSLEYNTHLFDRDTARRTLHDLRAIFEAVTAQTDLRILDILLLSQGQRSAAAGTQGQVNLYRNDKFAF